MKIVKLTEDNMEQYSESIDPDYAENIGRANYRGVVAEDSDGEGFSAAIVWELLGLDDEDRETEARIEWMRFEDVETGEDIFEEYGEAAAEDFVFRSFFELEDCDEVAESVLSDEDFSISSVEGEQLHLTVAELTELPIGKKKPPAHVKELSVLSGWEYNSGIMNCLFHHHKGVYEDLISLPMNWYEQDISCCIKTDEKVSGLFLIHKLPSGTLIPVLLFAVGADFQMSLIEMMRFSLRKVVEKYPPTTKILIKRHTKEVKALAAKLFPGKKGKTAKRGERSEA